jgi:DNA repair protein SbcD/Mre11
MLKVLCTADVHIGRRASRLPDSARYTAAGAWLDIVNFALAQRVDAVLLAGDLVDEQNRFFEASGPVNQGIHLLREAEIPIVAVSGNHDYEITHRVAAAAGRDHLVVLGRGGNWERHTIRDAAGRPVLHVDGWSFPSPRFAESPLATYSLEAPNDDAPLVGLLHCDLNATVSHYAPVPHSALAGGDHAAWVLGHIHTPALRETHGGASVLYPGSPLPLDPGEPGGHGVWLMELAPGQPPAFQRFVLSPVRYETVHVDLTGLADEDLVRSSIVAAVLERLDGALGDSGGRLEVLCCRLRLHGRTPLHGRLEEIVRRADDLEPTLGDARAVIDSRRIIDTLPALDLEDLARGRDAAARLAQVLLALESGDADVDGTLLEPIRRAEAEVAGRPHYQRLRGGGDPDRPAEAGARLRVLLKQQAALLLDGIMSQKEAE